MPGFFAGTLHRMALSFYAYTHCSFCCCSCSCCCCSCCCCSCSCCSCSCCCCSCRVARGGASSKSVLCASGKERELRHKPDATLSIIQQTRVRLLDFPLTYPVATAAAAAFSQSRSIGPGIPLPRARAKKAHFAALFGGESESALRMPACVRRAPWGHKHKGMHHCCLFRSRRTTTSFSVHILSWGWFGRPMDTHIRSELEDYSKLPARRFIAFPSSLLPPLSTSAVPVWMYGHY